MDLHTLVVLCTNLTDLHTFTSCKLRNYTDLQLVQVRTRGITLSITLFRGNPHVQTSLVPSQA